MKISVCGKENSIEERANYLQKIESSQLRNGIKYFKMIMNN